MCENAEALNKAYADAPLALAPATYTSVQRANQHELTQIVEKAGRLGFRRCGFGLVTAPAAYAPRLDEVLCRSLSDAYQTAARNGLFVELYPAKVGAFVYEGGQYIPADDFIVRTRCDEPLMNAVIRYDGEVCLCCNYGAAVGSAAEESFLTIWQSARYNKLREAVNSPGAMPEGCRNCWWVNR